MNDLNITSVDISPDSGNKCHNCGQNRGQYVKTGVDYQYICTYCGIISTPGEDIYPSWVIELHYPCDIMSIQFIKERLSPMAIRGAIHDNRHPMVYAEAREIDPISHQPRVYVYIQKIWWRTIKATLVHLYYVLKKHVYEYINWRNNRGKTQKA